MAVLAVAVALVGPGSAGSAAAAPRERAGQVYSATILKARSGASFIPAGGAINNRGQVAGSTPVGGNDRAAVFDTRTRSMRVLGTFGGQNSYATDINRHGDVTGYAQDRNGVERAFFWSARNKILQRLKSPAAGSRAVSMNDRDQVVGSVADASLGSIPVLWQSPSASPRTLPGLQAAATVINNKGWIGGRAFDETTFLMRPTRWRPKAYTREWLPIPAGNDSGQVNDINDRGQAVGYVFSFATDDLLNRTVLWSGRAARPCLLDGPGWTGSAAAINNRGQVIGQQVSTDFDHIRAATWRSCGSTTIVLPAVSGDDRPGGINNRGLIVGTSAGASPQGVRWDRSGR